MSTQVAATAATTDPAVARRAKARRATSGPAGSGNGRKWLEILLFVTPALVLMGLFVVYPIISAVRMSYYSWKGFGPMDNFVGLDNYTSVLTDEVFTDAVGHNFIIVFLSVAVGFVGSPMSFSAKPFQL